LTVSHCAIKGGLGGVVGPGAIVDLGSNIEADPLFFNQAGSDFRLPTGSPCVDHGTNQLWMVDAVDLAGAPRMVNGTVDIGTYETGEGSSWSLVVTETSGRHGTPTPYGYGTNHISTATAVANTVDSPADETNGTQYVCTGWVGTGSVPASGSSNSVSFIIMTNSTLTWNWQQQHFLDTEINGNGFVNVADGWRDRGSSVVIIAVREQDHYFAGWSGDTNGCVSDQTGARRVIRWTGSPGWRYTVEWASALAGPWSVVASNIAANGSANLYADTVASGHYRVRGSHPVWLPGSIVAISCWDQNDCYGITVPMNRARQIVANFSVSTHKIMADSGSHGSIAPHGSVTVAHGAGASFTIRPDAQYHISDVMVDGVSVGPVGSYRFSNVTTDHTIEAAFDINKYWILGRVHSGDPGGGPVVVEAFDSAAFSNAVSSMLAPAGSLYRLSELPALGNYWLRAYLDGNGNGTWDASESYGYYGANPIRILTGNIWGADIWIRSLAPVTGLVARPGVDSVMLRWSASAESGAGHYNVYRAEDEAGPFMRLNNEPLDTADYVDRVVVAGQTYYYYVTAVRLVDGAESPASAIVTVSLGEIALWMPDYFGEANSTVRLQINAASARGILAADMNIEVAYDPALLTPISQVVSNTPTVQKTAITESMMVTDNGATATGVIEIVAAAKVTRGATLKILGCDMVNWVGQPLAVNGRYSTDAGGTWQTVNNFKNLNDGRVHAVDLAADVAEGTDAILAITAMGHEFRSDRDVPFWVNALHRGDCVTNLPGIKGADDLAYYLQPLVDSNMVVNIGPDDVLYLFELGGDSWDETSAPWQDVVALVEFNAGRSLIGAGRLFDILFRVSKDAVAGDRQTNSLVSAELKGQQGNHLSVNISDTAVFSVTNLYTLGDVTGDGVVDMRDVFLAARLAAGVRPPSAHELQAGDIDRNEVITGTDVTLIWRIYRSQSINPGSGIGVLSLAALDDSGGGYELSIGDFEAQPGSTISVPVLIDNAEAVASIQVRVNCNAALLSLLSVTNGSLTSDFVVEYVVSGGSVDIVLSRNVEMPPGSGEIARILFRVNPAARPGMFTDLTLASSDLGTQYGGDLAWANSVSKRDGVVWIVASDVTDTDHDGLSDYAEQMFDGSFTVEPYHESTNPYGTDTDMERADTDSDRMGDGWEVGHGLNPLRDDAAVDGDADGASNWEESIADTNPNDGGDVLRVDVAADGSTGIVLAWESTVGRRYTVRTSTNLAVGAWVDMPSFTRIQGTGYPMQFTNAAPRVGGVYYRVCVEIP